jgi:hypothetical protein
MTRAFVRVVGGVIGAAIGAGGVWLCHEAFDSGAGAGFAAAGGFLGVTLLAYILATALRDETDNPGTASDAFRGGLIGLNAGANAALWGFIGVLPLGIGLAGLAALSLSNTIAKADAYEAILGWSNWLLPMSWLIVGLGLAFIVVSLIGWGVTGGQVEYFKLKDFDVDWTTGTMFLTGGWIANLNSYDTAFNMGNFAFVDKDNTMDDTEHEAGHTLNLAVFGSLFHLIGFVDEVILSRGNNAFSEMLANSHHNNKTPNIPMWV